MSIFSLRDLHEREEKFLWILHKITDQIFCLISRALNFNFYLLPVLTSQSLKSKNSTPHDRSLRRIVLAEEIKMLALKFSVWTSKFKSWTKSLSFFNSCRLLFTRSKKTFSIFVIKHDRRRFISIYSELFFFFFFPSFFAFIATTSSISHSKLISHQLYHGTESDEEKWED